MVEWRIYALIYWAIIGSNNGLSSVRRQAMILTNPRLLLIDPLCAMTPFNSIFCLSGKLEKRYHDNTFVYFVSIGISSEIFTAHLVPAMCMPLSNGTCVCSSSNNMFYSLLLFLIYSLVFKSHNNTLESSVSFFYYRTLTNVSSTNRGFPAKRALPAILKHGR